ncbi:hypothetical protein [Streptococcus thoraltensis]|uniref:hypothetical protein n=1 Tax=Streptococcus thoraltensis TaxID=55085 RepID=UPI001F5A2875|nr:hypothetical protein [Streptococcus thoraltensis]
MTLDELKSILNSIDDFETVILHSLVGDFIIDRWVDINRGKETLVFIHNDQTTEIKWSAILATSTIPKSF